MVPTGPATATVRDAADRLTRAITARPRRPPVTLTVLITVPSDRTLFAVFTAASPYDVTDTCARAGWPADRITAGANTWTSGATT